VEQARIHEDAGAGVQKAQGKTQTKSLAGAFAGTVCPLFNLSCFGLHPLKGSLDCHYLFAYIAEPVENAIDGVFMGDALP
jgi:hypothetical protein